ncbi:MAG: SEC-C metal-binding domain-containing protein [Pirellulaceae bacterium]
MFQNAKGALVSYARILSGKSLSAGGNTYTFDARYQGREFLVDDRYCPNPHFDCQAVHLEFFEAVSQGNGKQRIYQRFLGRVTFAGQLTVEETFKGSRSEANAVLSAWWKQYSQELKMLADRYRDVKKIGQRSLDTQPSRGLADTRQGIASPFTRDMLWNDPPTANVKVGRNAACPCGSGMKYKRCCGRKAVLSF